MATTTSTAIVTDRRATPEELAEKFVDELLDVRDTYLKRAPKDGAVHQLRRSLKIARIKAIEILLRVMFADVDDGAPPAAVTAWMLSAITQVEQRAQERAQLRGEPVVGPHAAALIERENRIGDEGDVIERALLRDPNDIALIDQRLAQSATYRDADDRLCADLRARKARELANGAFMRLA